MLLTGMETEALLLCDQNTRVNGEGGGHVLGTGVVRILGPQGIMLRCLSVKTCCSQMFGPNENMSVLSILPQIVSISVRQVGILLHFAKVTTVQIL